METITTPDELYDWTRDMDGEAGDGADTVMHLLQDRLTNDEWSLTMLCALGADVMMTAEPRTNGIRLMSTKRFKRKYENKIDVILPHAAFERFTDGGRCHLMFGLERHSG